MIIKRKTAKPAAAGRREAEEIWEGRSKRKQCVGFAAGVWRRVYYV
jgi:hypothetical protein